MIEWKATHRQVIELLQNERLPWHYRQAYHKTVCLCEGQYSDKTNPIEKFRQYYAEHHREEVGFIKGGYLVLRHWFPRQQQLNFLPPRNPLSIKGNCLIAYDAGFEQALRQPHMYDHFDDANTFSRSERRKRAALIENHIRDFFAKQYPEFYRSPSNHELYTEPAKEDFFLKLPTIKLAIDVKSWSFEREDGRIEGVARKPSKKIVYLWADWLETTQITIMHGICSGSWLTAIGTKQKSLIHITDNLIWPIDCLIVMLNMARADLNYHEFRQNLLEIQR